MTCMGPRRASEFEDGSQFSPLLSVKPARVRNILLSSLPVLCLSVDDQEIADSNATRVSRQGRVPAQTEGTTVARRSLGLPFNNHLTSRSPLPRFISLPSLPSSPPCRL